LTPNRTPAAVGVPARKWRIRSLAAGVMVMLMTIDPVSMHWPVKVAAWATATLSCRFGLARCGARAVHPYAPTCGASAGVSTDGRGQCEAGSFRQARRRQRGDRARLGAHPPRLQGRPVLRQRDRRLLLRP